MAWASWGPVGCLSVPHPSLWLIVLGVLTGDEGQKDGRPAEQHQISRPTRLCAQRYPEEQKAGRSPARACVCVTFEWYLLEVYVFGDLALLFGGGAYLSLGQGGKKGQVWDAVRNLVVGQCPGLWVS